MNPSDWPGVFRDRVTDAVDRALWQMYATVYDLRCRADLAELVETDRVLRAKRGCRRRNDTTWTRGGW